MDLEDILVYGFAIVCAVWVMWAFKRKERLDCVCFYCGIPGLEIGDIRHLLCGHCYLKRKSFFDSKLGSKDWEDLKDEML